MRILFTLMLLTFLGSAQSFSQEKSGRIEERTFYSTQDSEVALIRRVDNKNQKIEEVNIGRHPKVIINLRDSVLILETELIPDLTENRDSSLYRYVKGSITQYWYVILKIVPQNELPKGVVEAYIIRRPLQGSRPCLFTALDKTENNIFENVYITFEQSDDVETFIHLHSMAVE